MVRGCYKRKDKVKKSEHLPRPTEMDFDGINLADAWKKWKQTMQLYSNAAMNQKTAEKAGEIFNTWPGKRS